MQAPGVCFVCERTPDEGSGYVDTLSTFTPGFPSQLAGAKYICDQCVKVASEAAGFYADETVKANAAKVAEAEGRFAAVVDHVVASAEAFKADVLDEVGKRAPVVVAAVAAKSKKKSDAEAVTPEA